MVGVSPFPVASLLSFCHNWGKGERVNKFENMYRCTVVLTTVRWSISSTYVGGFFAWTGWKAFFRRVFLVKLNHNFFCQALCFSLANKVFWNRPVCITNLNKLKLTWRFELVSNQLLLITWTTHQNVLTKNKCWNVTQKNKHQITFAEVWCV